MLLLLQAQIILWRHYAFKDYYKYVISQLGTLICGLERYWHYSLILNNFNMLKGFSA